MEINQELVDMYKMIRAYDPDMECEKSRRFATNIFNLDIDTVVPLTKEETFLYRCLIGVYKVKNNAHIAREMHKHRFGIRKMKSVVHKTLRLYFLDVLRNAPDYPPEVNVSNSNITITNIGLSYRCICTLRNFRCYHLMDVACINLEFLKSFVGEKDFEILINKMKEVGLPLNWYQKRERLVMCCPHLW